MQEYCNIGDSGFPSIRRMIHVLVWSNYIIKYIKTCYPLNSSFSLRWYTRIQTYWKSFLLAFLCIPCYNIIDVKENRLEVGALETRLIDIQQSCSSFAANICIQLLFNNHIDKIGRRLPRWWCYSVYNTSFKIGYIHTHRGCIYRKIFLKFINITHIIQNIYVYKI